VGAGPVGLFLANECARRSLSWRIVEQNAGQSQYSKALAVMPRTLEILDMAGVVEPFLTAANRTTNVAKLIFAPAQSPYPFIAMVPQNVTEALLVEELRRKGGAVEYETTLVSAVQTEDGVVASLERCGERFSVNARYVVGCDGAHSTVRKLLGLPFEGAEYDASFMLADVETNAALARDEMQLCSHEEGPLAIFPMSSTRRRIVATVKHANGTAPSLDLVRAILAKRGPEGIEAHALNWSSYFRVHHRHVARLQAGRIFVAGDAAHIHSPFGGQGMNTGLHDAWNLAWKLDLTLRGHARAALISVVHLPAFVERRA
jgi:2-polyprenyl-6-methoxyphenol hydroxylase-like FAD-dependent oxidoreductase